MATLDFIPIQTTFEPVKKIVSGSSDFYLNDTIISILNLLEMSPGHNVIYPEMGIKNLILQIPFSEDLDNISNKINEQLNRFLSSKVTMEIEKDIKDPEIFNLIFSVEGAPGKIKTGLEYKGKNYVRVVNPKLIVS